MIVSVLAGGVYVDYVMCWAGSGCITVSCLIVVPSLVFNVKVKLCHMCVVNPGTREALKTRQECKHSQIKQFATNLCLMICSKRLITFK